MYTFAVVLFVILMTLALAVAWVASKRHRFPRQTDGHPDFFTKR